MSYKYEGVLKVIRRSRAILIWGAIVQPRWVPEKVSSLDRPSLRDRRHLLVHGDHSANVFQIRVLLEVATLIFSVGVPMVKPRRSGFLLLGRPSPEVQTPSPGIFMGIIVRMCPTNMRGF